MQRLISRGERVTFISSNTYTTNRFNMLMIIEIITF